MCKHQITNYRLRDIIYLKYECIPLIYFKVISYLISIFILLNQKLCYRQDTFPYPLFLEDTINNNRSNLRQRFYNNNKSDNYKEPTIGRIHLRNRPPHCLPGRKKITSPLETSAVSNLSTLTLSPFIKQTTQFYGLFYISASVTLRIVSQIISRAVLRTRYKTAAVFFLLLYDFFLVAINKHKFTVKDGAWRGRVLKQMGSDQSEGQGQLSKRHGNSYLRKQGRWLFLTAIGRYRAACAYIECEKREMFRQ